MATVFLLGLIFGFLLVRGGATDPAVIVDMFTLRDLHLMGVIGAAVLVAAPGIRWMERRAARRGDPSPFGASKPFKPGLLFGALLFGAGWAATATCPGTALAQIGEGRLVGLATTAGILLGAALHRSVGAGLEGWLGRIGQTSRRQPEREGASAARPDAAC